VPWKCGESLHAVVALLMVWFGRYERFLAVIKWFVGLKFAAIMGSVVLILLWSGADWSGFGARSAVLASPTRCRSSAVWAAP
jgi:hypothetical protein